jgi:hypothetical protein
VQLSISVLFYLCLFAQTTEYEKTLVAYHFQVMKRAACPERAGWLCMCLHVNCLGEVKTVE